MIARIRIEINLTEKEAISFLKKNVVKITNRPTFGLIEHLGTWKNLENPRNFKFEINTFGHISPWWGKCSLKEIENKSLLSILILPPSFFLIFVGFILSGTFYAIVQFGIHNYGTIGFLPSILIPSFCTCFVFTIWHLIARFNANKVKKDMISSFQAQLEREKNN